MLTSYAIKTPDTYQVRRQREQLIRQNEKGKQTFGAYIYS